MRTKISVTAADIEQAKARDSVRCVVAVALARTLKQAHRIEIDLQAIRFTQGGERFVYLTPYDVQRYVVAFDQGDELEPFSFMLTDRNRLTTQVKRTTEAGKAVAKARRHKTQAQAKLTELEQVAETAPPAEREAAAAALPEARTAAQEAERELEQVTAANAGKKQVERTGEGRRDGLPRGLPRGHRANRREYGVRGLSR